MFQFNIKYIAHLKPQPSYLSKEEYFYEQMCTILKRHSRRMQSAFIVPVIWHWQCTHWFFSGLCIINLFSLFDMSYYNWSCNNAPLIEISISYMVPMYWYQFVTTAKFNKQDLYLISFLLSIVSVQLYQTYNHLGYLWRFSWQHPNRYMYSSK